MPETTRKEIDVLVDAQDIQIMADAAVNVVHCPTTALKVSYGITQVGKFPLV